MSTVSCKQLCKTFGEGELAVHALSDINIEFDSGSFACLSGPSGSGKTTLLNMIGGLDTPTSGEITIADRRVDQMNKAKLANMRLKHIGFVFQAYNLIPVLSAKENVEFVMQLQGVSTSERDQRTMKILEEVGLKGMEDRRPAEMSGGQQQRVAVARAIVSSPDLVLADEPSGNPEEGVGRTDPEPGEPNSLLGHLTTLRCCRLPSPLLPQGLYSNLIACQSTSPHLPQPRGFPHRECPKPRKTPAHPSPPPTGSIPSSFPR